MLVISCRDFCRTPKRPGNSPSQRRDHPLQHSRIVLASWVFPDREHCLVKRRGASFVALLRGVARAASMSMLAVLPVLAACAPKVSAGVWECPVDDGAAGAPANTDPVTVPWSTGFEDGFCEYVQLAGYCYGDSSYVLVNEPHRPEGHWAAEFKVIGDGWDQTRCVRQGVLPESAVYGAWYFIPEALQEANNWNLFHFQGGDAPGPGAEWFWDVTLYKIPQSESWELGVRDYMDPNDQADDPIIYTGAEHKPVPIGKWFHIELFLKRASDSTGKIALYQDGVLLFERANLKSNVAPFTEWYVGDWAADATPADSSLYVDDVSIGTTRSATRATP